jgi:hypothetical protein
MSKENFKVSTPVIYTPESGESGLLNLYDQSNPDINLFNMIDDEAIKLTGSPILYFKYLGNETSFDKIYLEDRNKIIAKEGILVVGHFDPKIIEENLSEFGIELTNDQVFTFNKSYLEYRLERSVKVGDVIQPKFQNIKYEIFEVQEDSFEAYGVYHLICSARILRDNAEVLDITRTETNDLEGYGR